MPDSPSPEHVIRNWNEHDGPFVKKAWLLFRNNAKKVATLSTCCGNHGEPGC